MTSPPPFRWFWSLARRFFISPEEGARATLYLATSPEVEGRIGGYYERCKRIAPSRAALDGAAALRLWEESERLMAGLGLDNC